MKMEKKKLRLKLAQDPIGISVGELVPFDRDIAMYPIFLTRGFHATAEGHEEEKKFAHRIVASFNACEGIPIEALESPNPMPLIFQDIQVAIKFERLKAVNAQMLEALQDAEIQIEYLHEKFKPTGSGNKTLSLIRSAISATTNT